MPTGRARTPAAPAGPGTKCEDREIVLKAFDDIMTVSLQLLCDHINHVEESDDEQKNRNWVAAMLNKLPLTCKAMRDKTRGDARYTAIMFYERTRLGAANSGHFLEGLGAGLPLFSGETAVALREQDLRDLKLRSVVADRIRTVNNLEELANGGEKLAGLVRDFTLTDIPRGVPPRVHVFLSRMRAICQGLQRVKPATHFKQCRNCECNRCFYAGAPNETVESTVLPATRPVAISDGVTGQYWDMVAGGAEVGFQQGEFCTWSCYVQWKTQLGHALPDISEGEMVCDYGCRGTGRSRVGEALRLCSKRNERASRHLRTIQKERRVFPALGASEMRKQMQRRIRMLNVDLGLLYSASVLAQSSTMTKNKVLAGASEGWRSRPLFYAKAVKEVIKLYEKYHIGGNVIANMHVYEPFLNKLKERALKIF